jgi:hypothetical protein
MSWLSLHKEQIVRTFLIPLVVVLTANPTSVWAQAGDPFKKPSPATPAPAAQTPPAASKPEQPSETRNPGVDLRPKFKKGQELRYVLELDGKNKIKSVSASKDEEPLDNEQTSSQRIGLVMRVKDAGDEGATLDIVYESIKVVMDTPEGKAEFDSTKKKTPASKPGTPAKGAVPDPLAGGMSDMLAQIIGPMVGTTIEVKTDRNGAITSVTGGSALGGGGLEGLLGGMGGAGGGMMPDAKSTANWLVGGMGGPSSGFARIGETWTNTDTLSGTPLGGFKMITSHALKSLSGNIANVLFNGRAETTDSQDAPSPLGSLVKLKGAGYRGQYQWDTTAGCLKELSSELNTQTTCKIGQQDVEMTSTSTTRVKKQ